MLATLPTRQELDAPQHRKRCTLQQYLNKAAAQVKAEDFKTAQKTLDSVRLTAIEHNFPWVEAEAVRSLVCAFEHSQYLAFASLKPVGRPSVHELSRLNPSGVGTFAMFTCAAAALGGQGFVKLKLYQRARAMEYLQEGLKKAKALDVRPPQQPSHLALVVCE